MNHSTADRIRTYCRRKGVSLSPKAYFIDAFGAMALGLFASLLIGTIFQTLGERIGIEPLLQIATFARQATGAAIGVAIASSLGCSGLLLFCSVAVGMAGNQLGGPIGAYLAAVVSMEVGKLVFRTTKVDILVTPSVAIITGVTVAILLGGPVGSFMTMLGNVIQHATHMHPFLMGIVVSVIVGMLLTLPVSSAAVCIAISLGGLAGGAATAGCCAQMIGFAVMSFPDNRWGGLLAQGLGTSMLQIPNIIRKPSVWIPPTLTSVITGPLSTCVFHLENIPVGSGMGTCGLVGPIGVYTAMPDGGTMMWVGIALVCFILPALLTWGIAAVMRRKGWLLPGDLRISY